MFTLLLFFFKQKTAYEMRIIDWSSDVCSSDLASNAINREKPHGQRGALGSFLIGEIGHMPLAQNLAAREKLQGRRIRRRLGLDEHGSGPLETCGDRKSVV